ncbi:MAG: insulinase family protein, partial [Spirochaetales bacterium]
QEFDPSVIFYEKIVPIKNQTTIGDYFEWFKNNVAAQAVSLRLSDLTRAGGKSWVEAYFDDDYFYGMTRIFAFTLSARSGSELAAFSDLAVEVERLRRHGFTESEFKRTVDGYRRWLTTLDVEDQDLRSGNFADEYVRNFMYDEPVPGVINERVYIKDALDALTLQDLNMSARSILADDEGFVAVRAMAAPADGSINEADFESALETARARAIEPLAVSDTAQVGLFDGEPEGGSIVSEELMPNNITELILSNGARVLIKPTTYDNDSVNFVGWSLGGYSALPLDDYYAAAFAPTLLGTTGLGDMDATQLQEATALANVGLSWRIAENGTSLSGKSATGDLHTLLRIVYLTAAEPGKDQAAFNLMRDRLAEQIGPYAQDPGYRFETAWSSHLFNDNPRAAPLDASRVKALSYDKVMATAVQALTPASRFTYVLVGDVALPEAKRLAAKYLGALPSGTVTEPQWQEPLRPRKDAGVRVDFPFARENRASVKMVWAAEAPWSWEREQTLDLLAQALNNRLLDAIREDLGGTYVVSTSGTFSRMPLEQYALVVSFNCDPARVDELIAEVRAEVASLADGRLNPMYVQQIKAAAQREYDGTNRTNTYWVKNLANAVAYGLDYEIIGRAKLRIELADPELFKTLAAETLRPDREFVYVMTPEN